MEHGSQPVVPDLLFTCLNAFCWLGRRENFASRPDGFCSLSRSHFCWRTSSCDCDVAQRKATATVVICLGRVSWSEGSRRRSKAEAPEKAAPKTAACLLHIHSAPCCSRTTRGTGVQQARPCFHRRLRTLNSFSVWIHATQTPPEGEER